MRTKEAIQHFGSRAALARALGISRAAVSKWGRNVPQLRALELEKLTYGRLNSNWKAQGETPRTAA